MGRPQRKLPSQWAQQGPTPELIAHERENLVGGQPLRRWLDVINGEAVRGSDRTAEEFK